MILIKISGLTENPTNCTIIEDPTTQNIPLVIRQAEIGALDVNTIFQDTLVLVCCRSQENIIGNFLIVRHIKEVRDTLLKNMTELLNLCIGETVSQRHILWILEIQVN